MNNKQLITCTWSGRPLEDLSKLISLRVRTIKDTTENAVCATAVTALKSIRAMTRVAHAQRVKDRDIKIVDRTSDLVPGWKNRRRVIRKHGQHGQYFLGMPKNMKGSLGGTKWLVGAYMKGENPRVYWARYTPPWANDDGYTNGLAVGFFVAMSEADVRDWMRSHIRKRVRKHAKLAKNAISIAIGKIASMHERLDGSREAREAAGQFALVQKEVGPNYYGINFVDGLGYSLKAVKGGQSGVDLALKKAANLMASRIWMYAEKMGMKNMELRVPFPEIKRKL